MGAGERILASDLAGPRRIWEDTADTGFLGWARHDDTVVTSAELELAAWSALGEKLWTTFVGPPWEYSVENGIVRLDVMGNVGHFPLCEGPG